MLLPEVSKLNSSGKNSFTSVSVSYGRIIILVASKFFFFQSSWILHYYFFFPGNLTELEGNLVFSDTLFGNNLRQLSCFYC